MDEKVYPGVGIYCEDEFMSHYIQRFNEHKLIVRGICGLEPVKLKKIADEFNINVVSTEFKVFLLHSDIQLVVFINPTPDLTEYICHTLTVAGKHVLCCQNIGNSIKFNDLYSASLKYLPLVSLIANPFRFAANFKKARSFINTNSIGKILYVDCAIVTSLSMSYKNEYTFEFTAGGGILQQYVIYVIDGVETILNESIYKVRCNWYTIESFPIKTKCLKRSNTDDYLNFSAKLSSEILLSITARTDLCKSDDFYQQNIQIVGTLGKIVMENGSIELKMNQSLSIDLNEISNNAFPPKMFDFVDDLALELQDIFAGGVFNANTDNIRNCIPFKQGDKLQLIIEAAIESNVSDRSVHMSEITASNQNSFTLSDDEENKESMQSVAFTHNSSKSFFHGLKKKNPT